MHNEHNEQNDSWSWLDVFTRSGGQWVFRKRVARDYDSTYEKMRVEIARTLSSSPAVPMSLDDFKLVKRP